VALRKEGERLEQKKKTERKEKRKKNSKGRSARNESTSGARETASLLEKKGSETRRGATDQKRRT